MGGSAVGLWETAWRPSAGGTPPPAGPSPSEGPKLGRHWVGGPDRPPEYLRPNMGGWAGEGVQSAPPRRSDWRRLGARGILVPPPPVSNLRNSLHIYNNI